MSNSDLNNKDLDELLSAGIDNVVSLNLECNNITTVESLQPLVMLMDLRNLSLSGCPVCDVEDYRDKVFALLPELEYLDREDRDGNVNEDGDFAGEKEVDWSTVTPRASPPPLTSPRVAMLRGVSFGSGVSDSFDAGTVFNSDGGGAWSDEEATAGEGDGDGAVSENGNETNNNESATSTAPLSSPTNKASFASIAAAASADDATSSTAAEKGRETSSAATAAAAASGGEGDEEDNFSAGSYEEDDEEINIGLDALYGDLGNDDDDDDFVDTGEFVLDDDDDFDEDSFSLSTPTAGDKRKRSADDDEGRD